MILFFFPFPRKIFLINYFYRSFYLLYIFGIINKQTKNLIDKQRKIIMLYFLSLVNQYILSKYIESFFFSSDGFYFLTNAMTKIP